MLPLFVREFDDASPTGNSAGAIGGESFALNLG